MSEEASKVRTTAPSAVRFENVSKRFGSVLANDGVTFEVLSGSFHAILGENGAGKSTLMNILSGAHRPDEGVLTVGGRVMSAHNPKEARRLGVGMVHQHLSLIPAMTVAENMLLHDDEAGWLFWGKLSRGHVKPDKRRRFVDVAGHIRELEKVPVADLSTAEKQQLEVFRLLHLGAEVLILDEPTSLLSETEGDALLERMRTLVEEGRTVILVTHKLREVRRFCDSVTVLRKGRVQATIPVDKNLDDKSLANLLVGAADARLDAAARPFREVMKNVPVLRVANVSYKASSPARSLDRVSFEVIPGRILGVAGVAGNGQDELAEVVAGLAIPTDGQVVLMHRTDSKPSRVRYVPSDRLGVGVAVELTIAENLVLRDFMEPPLMRKGILDRAAILAAVTRRARRFDVQADDLNACISNLSGGNIQRVILGRELDGAFDVLVAHDPTAGLDLNATALVRVAIRDCANAGAGVLLISSDLDEVFELADDMMVLFHGQNRGVFDPRSLTRAQIGELMAGRGTLSAGAA